VSPVVWHDESGEARIYSDTCADCGQPLYDTGCGAADCPGLTCLDCCIGCDIETAPEGGQCAQTIAAETEEERAARIDRERAAWGLPPISGGSS
jgi:hypothetical protein